MSILLPLIILFLCILANLILRRWRPGFAYFWVVTTGGALLAWLALVFLYSFIPKFLVVTYWQVPGVISTPLALRVNTYAWVLGVGVLTLLLSMLLTDIVRQRGGWLSWTVGLLTSLLVLLALFSANPITLIIGWGALDLCELLLYLSVTKEKKHLEQVIVSFSGRAVSLILLLWFAVHTGTVGSVLAFSLFPGQMIDYLLLAACLRIFVLPPLIGSIDERRFGQGISMVLRLMPLLVCLDLFVRSATEGISLVGLSKMYIIGVLMTLLGGMVWVGSKDEVEGSAFWVLGWSGLILAGVVLGKPQASLAWGLVMLFGGALVWLSSVRTHVFVPIFAVGLLGMAALPYSPAFAGAQIFQSLDVWTGMMMVGQVLLSAGFIRFVVRTRAALVEQERWVKVVYPFGLLLLPFTHFGLGWIALRTEIGAGWWVGVVMLGLAAILFGAGRFKPRLFSGWESVNQFIQRFFSMGWLFRLAARVYQWLGQILYGLSNLLEGEAGLLWTFLLLILLFSFLSRRVGGG
ncbi:MAG: hypothetical protein AB1345_14295 [Chloroflexota bacterium]